MSSDVLQTVPQIAVQPLPAQSSVHIRITLAIGSCAVDLRCDINGMMMMMMCRLSDHLVLCCVDGSDTVLEINTRTLRQCTSLQV
jgi:hypothetical protein